MALDDFHDAGDAIFGADLCAQRRRARPQRGRVHGGLNDLGQLFGGQGLHPREPRANPQFHHHVGPGILVKRKRDDEAGHARAQAGAGGAGAVHWLFNTPQLRRLGPLCLRSQLLGFAQKLYLQSWHDPAQADWTDLTGFEHLTHTENWDRALWELLAAARPFETLLHVETISAPTLVITGDDDRVLGTAATVSLAHKMSNAQLAVLPACGHMPQEECPEAFMQAVRHWATEHP